MAASPPRIVILLATIGSIVLVFVLGLAGYFVLEMWSHPKGPRKAEAELPPPRTRPLTQEEQGPTPLHSGAVQLQARGGVETHVVEPLPAPEQPRATLVGELKGHQGAVLDAEFLADEKQLVTLGIDQTIRLWDVANRQELHQFAQSEGGLIDLAVSRDGKLLAAACSDGLVRFWDVESRVRKGELRGHQGGVRCLVYSRDGTKILTGGDDRTVRVWDTATGRSLKVLYGHEGPVLNLAFSSDGAWAVSGSQDRSVIYWDLTKGVIRNFIYSGEPVPSVALLSDDRRAILLGASRISLWDVQGFEFLGDRQGVPDMPFKTAVVFYGGAFLACGGQDQKVMLYTLPDRKPVDIEQPVHGAPINCVKADSSGKLLLSAGEDGLVKVWNLSDLAVAAQGAAPTLGKIYSLAISDDGKYVAVGGKDTILLRKMGDDQEDHLLPGHAGFVLGLAFRDDGQELLSGGQDNTVRRWNLATLEGQELTKLKAFGYLVRYVPNQSSVVVATGGKIQIHDAKTGELQHSYLGHRSGDVYSVEFLADSKTIASTSGERTAVFWDLASRRETQRFKTGIAEGWPRHVSHDGQFMFTTESNATESFVGIWDLSTGTERRRFGVKGDFRGGLPAMAVSGDGNRLFFGVSHGAYCWDLTTNELLFSVAATRSEFKLAVFRKDGQQVVAVDANGAVHQWNLSDIEKP